MISLFDLSKYNKSSSPFVFILENYKSNDLDSNIGDSIASPPDSDDAAPDRAPQLDDALSFRTGVPAPQKRLLNRLLALGGLAAILFPSRFSCIAAWVLLGVFTLLLSWRLFLVLTGYMRRLLPRRTRTPIETTRPLPIYSILVAAYDEAALMPQLAKALSKIDWPADRLDVLILLEATDTKTLNAAQRAPFPPGTRIIQIPPGGPLTKPNALNHGLSLARGTFAVIYDVEDFPAPDQLRRAYAAFLHAPPETVCLQARLRADNETASWIAAQWGLEYDLLFGLLLPATAWLRLPVLIGGTSNHFRRAALMALGGWDAFNVTEDADLGMRIARAKLRTETLVSETREEAPARLRVWLPQRGRWIKGYIQTWLVLMRRPRQTLRQIGLTGFLAMQASLGGAILAPCAHAPLILLTLIAAVSGDLVIGKSGLTLMIAGYAISLLGDLAAPGRWTSKRLLAMLTKPLYWPLLTLAAYRAIWDLANRPHFWAKTPHHPKQAEPHASCSTGSSAPDSHSPLSG